MSLVLFMSGCFKDIEIKPDPVTDTSKVHVTGDVISVPDQQPLANIIIEHHWTFNDGDSHKYLAQTDKNGHFEGTVTLRWFSTNYLLLTGGSVSAFTQGWYLNGEYNKSNYYRIPVRISDPSELYFKIELVAEE